MRKLTFWLLSGFVFSLPWEASMVIPSIGTFSRLIGMAALAVGVLAIAGRGSIRKPGIIVCLGLAFTLANILSLLWTISFDDTVSRVVTFAQLFGLLWIMWEIVRHARESEWLMVAYCFGAYVSIAEALWRFARGEVWSPSGYTTVSALTQARYSGGNLNPNEFGAYVAIGIPVAWYLFLTQRRLLRLVAAAYLPFALLAILLTASRGAFLAAVVALSVVPLTASRHSLRSWSLAVVILFIGAGAAAVVAPQSAWDRILTAGEEVSAGTFGGRGATWAAALVAFQDSPMLGVGSGAFERAIQPLLGTRTQSPHNVFVAIALEQGLVGLTIFLALLGASVWVIASLPRPLRAVWAIIMLVWLVGSMSINWQYGKVTWLLFALLAVHTAAHRGHARPADWVPRIGEDLAGAAAVQHRRAS